MKIEIHNKFLPLLDRNSPYRNFCFYGGRDAMKSWSIAIALVYLSHNYKDLLLLCAKGTMTSIKDSVKELIENTLHYLNIHHHYHITDQEIIHKITGSKFIFKGLQKSERLKSLEGVDYLWVEEANIDTTEKSFDRFIPTIRKTGSKIIYSFNPDLEDDYVYDRFVLNKRDYDYIQKITYKDNKFLSEESAREIKAMKESNYAKYLHIYGGELAIEVEGALWDRQMIKHKIISDLVFDEVVVAVDPSTTNKATSDECGIVVAGIKDDLYYVLDDVSNIMSPLEWANMAIAMYDKWGATRIVYESNQGGEMTKTIIHQVREAIRVVPVHARKSKISRAEEIVSLYEQEKVYHVKRFTKLEYEMVTFTGDKKDKSPNRLDALVYALRNLAKKQLAPHGHVRANMQSVNRRSIMTAKR